MAIRGVDSRARTPPRILAESATMSHDDPYGPNGGRDRGAYTPPTDDDDLPFHRPGGYDPRRAPASKSPPLTLIISAVVLLLLIVAVIAFYRSGVRSSTDAPPAVGAPVGDLKTEAPIDAQPTDPEAGVTVYDNAEDPAAAPTFTPPPETVLPRPAPQPAPVAGGALPPARPAPTPTAPTPAAPVRPAPAPVEKAPATPAPAPSSAGGSSAVQIGAFSSREIADREYAAVAARFPAFASGRTKRVEQVTASNGSTVYRTTFNGLSREDARAFCDALKAAGRDCLVR